MKWCEFKGLWRSPKRKEALHGACRKRCGALRGLVGSELTAFQHMLIQHLAMGSSRQSLLPGTDGECSRYLCTPTSDGRYFGTTHQARHESFKYPCLASIQVLGQI